MSMSLAPLNRAELTLTIPQPGAHLGMGGGISMMDMSPAAAGSYQLPSPSFNNFMLTLSPLMQLSSPQATMSPRGHEDACGLGGNCAPVPAVPSAMCVCARMHACMRAWPACCLLFAGGGLKSVMLD